MKFLLAIILPMMVLGAAAQTNVPTGTWGYGLAPWQSTMYLPSFDAGNLKRPWQVRPFASLSAGYIFLNGGISYVSAPVGVALFHPLTTNWTAYGAATVTPVGFSFNRLATVPMTDPHYRGYPFGGGYGLGLTTGVQGGLIYTNDDRTFSISGSVHFERSTYPVYPSDRVHTAK